MRSGDDKHRTLCAWNEERELDITMSRYELDKQIVAYYDG